MAKACLPGTETISSSTSPAHPSSSSDNSNSINNTTTTTSSTKETTSTRPLRPRSTSTTKTTKTTKAISKTSDTMNRTSAALEIALPITYTPTTHRISKAKKGKRVHACEYPGCTKIFTRAEHRRRHELNHNPEALFKCSHPGCKRVFQRHDLLTRHNERHELEAQMESEAHWRTLLHSRMISEVPQMPKPMPDNAFYPTTQQPNTMSIESLLAPEFPMPLVNEQQPQMWSNLDMSMNSQSPPMIQEPVPEPIDHNPFYSYGESCPSPSSEGTAFSLNSRPSSSISSTPALVDSYPESILDCGLTSSPTPMHAELPSWDPSGADIVPLSLDGEFIQPVSTSYQDIRSHLKSMKLTLNQSVHEYQPSTWTRPYKEEYEPFESKEWL